MDKKGVCHSLHYLSGNTCGISDENITIYLLMTVQGYIKK